MICFKAIYFIACDYFGYWCNINSRGIKACQLQHHKIKWTQIESYPINVRISPSIAVFLHFSPYAKLRPINSLGLFTQHESGYVNPELFTPVKQFTAKVWNRNSQLWVSDNVDFQFKYFTPHVWNFRIQPLKSELQSTRDVHTWEQIYTLGVKASNPTTKPSTVHTLENFISQVWNRQAQLKVENVGFQSRVIHTLKKFTLPMWIRQTQLLTHPRCSRKKKSTPRKSCTSLVWSVLTLPKTESLY